MKYLLVLGVVLAGVWLWRHNREQEAAARAQARPAPQPAPATPDEMVACQHCGLHLPRAEARKGTLGYYCGTEHQRLHEG